ncbi:MAG: S41 family peptidase [Flavobacteriaceae bacterium]
MSESRLISRFFAKTLICFMPFLVSASPPNLFEISKQLDIFNTLFKEIQLNFVDETNPAELMTAAITEMMSTLDPYSVFMNEQDIESARLRQETDQASIGAKYKLTAKGILLTEIYKDGACDKAGLHVGDAIVSADGISLEDYNGDPSALLSGSNGSELLVSYQRKAKDFQAKLIRSNKEPSAVPLFQMMDNGVGYVALTQFTPNSAFELDQAIRLLQSEGLSGLILDLRGNPGGLLGQAIDIVNFFIPKNQLVVSTRSNLPSQNQVYITKKDPIALDLPVVVLINGRSASASEIVAGALQDLDRAVVMGERSFGKGLVQQQKPLAYGTQFKITISRYYTPSGRCIQALDYRNKDDKGGATKRDFKELQEFKTKNGRPVFDGGGVLPEVLISEESTPPIVKLALEQDVIFDYMNSLSDLNIFVNNGNISVSDKEFGQFLQQSKITVPSEEVLNQLEEALINDSLIVSMDQTLKILQDKLGATKREQIKLVQSTFKKQMAYEVALRLFYSEGLYQYKISQDSAISEAMNLLLNKERYNHYLKK